jgi:hypothetical protein
MLFTLFVAILAATLWALRSFFLDADTPHDPSTLELAVMGAITVATYSWMKRLAWLRERTAPVVDAADFLPPATPVPVRYAEAKAEAEHETAALDPTEHVA